LFLLSRGKGATLTEQNICDKLDILHRNPGLTFGMGLSSMPRTRSFFIGQGNLFHTDRIVIHPYVSLLSSILQRKFLGERLGERKR